MKKSPKKFKINILFIMALQLVAFTSVLFIEDQSSQANNPEVKIALENAALEIQDFEMPQACPPEGCQYFGP